MSRVFISYSRSDAIFANKLAATLSELGVEVWLDVKDISVGANWSTAIQQGLDSCDLMILILTSEAMESENVAAEWQYFVDERKPIVPVLLKSTKIHFQLRRLQYVDFQSRVFDAAIVELHAALKGKGISIKPLPRKTGGVLDGNESKPSPIAVGAPPLVEVIERHLRESLRLDPLEARLVLQDGYGWIYLAESGSVSIEIYLTKDKEEWLLQILSLLVNLPKSDAMRLMRYLLETNLQLSGSAFGIYQDGIYLFHEVPISELGFAAVPRLLDRFSAYAGELIKFLIKEFGLERPKRDQ